MQSASYFATRNIESTNNQTKNYKAMGNKNLCALPIDLRMYSPNTQRAKGSEKSTYRLDINGRERKLHVTVEASSEKGNK